MARRNLKLRMRWRGGKAATQAGPVGRFFGRLLATLFFGVFFGLGVFFTWMVLQHAARDLESYGWAERRCELERSEVVRAGGEEPYEPRVAYRSVDAGPELRGQEIQRRKLGYASHGKAAARLSPYPVGAIVPCFASDSGEITLERGPFWSGVMVLLPLIFAVIGGLGLYAVWSPDRPESAASGRPRLEALGAKVRRPSKGRVLIWMGSLFAILGGVLFWFMGARPFLQVQEARSWHAQRCLVEHSSVVAHQSDDGTTYRVDILYRWDRGRGVERSSRYRFFGGSSSGRASKAEIVNAHPKGAEVECWVHPEKRDEAVLERGLTIHASFAGVPLIFAVAGVGMFFQGRRASRRQTEMRNSALRGGLPFRADDPILDVLPDFEVRPGPVPLAPVTPRWMRLMGLVFVTLFWNGIVGVFLYQAFGGWQRGDADLFLMVFLVPFALVGVALFCAIFYELLAYWNPRPLLSASASTLSPGRSIDVQWRFDGRSERLGRVGLRLLGREEATYQVGTNSHTAREIFFEEVLADLPAPSCQMGGHVRVSIPSAAMHSFESEHNKVLWELEIVGEIPRWPDTKETYALVVLPRAGRGVGS